MNRTAPGISSPEAEIYRSGCDIHRDKAGKECHFLVS